MSKENGTKLYLMRFTHLEKQEILYKHGTTREGRLMERFNPSKWPERKLYVDFLIEPLFYMEYADGREAEASEAEKIYLNRFCSNNLNYFLKTEARYTPKTFSGYTEFFRATPEMIETHINEMQRLAQLSLREPVGKRRIISHRRYET